MKSDLKKYFNDMHFILYLVLKIHIKIFHIFKCYLFNKGVV